MRHLFRAVASAFVIAALSSAALAAPAMQVLGKDFTFPSQLEGMPAKLSDFKTMQVNSFDTSDGVKLSCGEAGSGKSLVFFPG